MARDPAGASRVRLIRSGMERAGGSGYGKPSRYRPGRPIRHGEGGIIYGQAVVQNRWDTAPLRDYPLQGGGAGFTTRLLPRMHPLHQPVLAARGAAGAP
jgi:hypothetical protein